MWLDKLGRIALVLAGKDGGQIYSGTNDTKAGGGSDGLAEHKSDIVAKCGRVDGDHGVPQSTFVGQNRIIPIRLSDFQLPPRCCSGTTTSSRVRGWKLSEQVLEAFHQISLSSLETTCIDAPR